MVLFENSTLSRILLAISFEMSLRPAVAFSIILELSNSLSGITRIALSKSGFNDWAAF